jgi:hypothetical protein
MIINSAKDLEMANTVHRMGWYAIQEESKSSYPSDQYSNWSSPNIRNADLNESTVVGEIPLFSAVSRSFLATNRSLPKQLLQ